MIQDGSAGRNSGASLSTATASNLESIKGVVRKERDLAQPEILVRMLL
jgi:hypothetical protein